MKTKLLTTIVGLLICSMSFAMSNKVQIESLISQYETALNNKEVKNILSLYGRHPTFMLQHAPAQIGRKAVEESYINVLKAIDLDIKFEIHVIEILGNTAWARTSSLGKTKIIESGAIVVEGNNELFIFKKEDGNWRIHQYLFSTNQPRK